MGRVGAFQRAALRLMLGARSIDDPISYIGKLQRPRCWRLCAETEKSAMTPRVGSIRAQSIDSETKSSPAFKVCVSTESSGSFSSPLRTLASRVYMKLVACPYVHDSDQHGLEVACMSGFEVNGGLLGLRGCGSSGQCRSQTHCGEFGGLTGVHQSYSRIVNVYSTNRLKQATLSTQSSLHGRVAVNFPTTATAGPVPA